MWFEFAYADPDGPFRDSSYGSRSPNGSRMGREGRTLGITRAISSVVERAPDKGEVSGSSPG